MLNTLKIDLYTRRIIKHLQIVINVKTNEFIRITQNLYFCLEDIFSFQGSGFKKTSSKDLQRTNTFKYCLGATSIVTHINKKDLIVKKQSNETFVHPHVAVQEAHCRSQLSVLFNIVVNELFFNNRLYLTTRFLP